MLLIKLGHISVMAGQITYIVEKEDGCEIVLFNGRTILTDVPASKIETELIKYGVQMLKFNDSTSEEE